MTSGICSVHDKKPIACANFPIQASDIKQYPNCGYSFTPDGKRMGECKKCGECCKAPFIYLPEFDKKFRHEPCPYLKETV